MIEIKKVVDPLRVKQICEANEIEFQENHHVIATIEREEVLNYAVFTYENEEGTIHAIGGFDGDINMLDGLCRAILNIMELNGVKQVYLPHKYGDLANHIGFKKENSVYVLQLEGFFCCKCSDKK